MKRLLILTTILLSAAAQAEVYRCKDAKGMTQYSDTPCAGAVAVDVRNVQPTTQGNPNDRMLTAYIQEAIARGDFNKASSLAVTPEHYQMISEARLRQDEAKEKRKVEAAASARTQRPVHCSTFKYTDQLAQTVCR